MTTDMPKPGHPLYAMTTFELQRYRRELDQALKDLPTQASIRADLQRKLGEVEAEEESRLSIQHARPRGTPGL
jgi:hypothetical protein